MALWTFLTLLVTGLFALSVIVHVNVGIAFEEGDILLKLAELPFNVSLLHDLRGGVDEDRQANVPVLHPAPCLLEALQENPLILKLGNLDLFLLKSCSFLL